MAINAPIQGTSADMIRIAMVEIQNYIEKENLEKDVRMLLQVHDELVFEIKDSVVKAVTPKLEALLEGVLNGKDTHGVPIIADTKVGDNWLDMKSA